MSEKILIIDDEQDIADLLEVYLKNENYIVYKFYCATDAMSCIESGDIDLAILDIMLPDMNGFSLCQLIRKKYTYPIIMLTAKIEETDKITGLTLGADDYVTKPFRPLEVVARVKAQLRRYKKYSPGIITEKVPSELSYNKLCLNVQTHECLLDGEPVSLTPTEFSILHVLLSSAGNVVSIERLINELFEITKYNAHTVIIKKENVDLHCLIAQVIDEIYPTLSANGNTAVFTAEDNLSVNADPEKLARVFSNLLRNAASYSYPQTEITISAKRLEHDIQITFENRGKTIPQEQLNSIFEKFNRLDDARLSNTGGAGLGLSIAEEIIHLHGGKITASSQNETIDFVITLPLSA